MGIEVERTTNTVIAVNDVRRREGSPDETKDVPRSEFIVQNPLKRFGSVIGYGIALRDYAALQRLQNGLDRALKAHATIVLPNATPYEVAEESTAIRIAVDLDHGIDTKF
jgi:hypothetical protein